MKLEFFARDVVIEVCTLMKGITSMRILNEYIRHMYVFYVSSHVSIHVSQDELNHLVESEPKLFRWVGDDYIMYSGKLKLLTNLPQHAQGFKRELSRKGKTLLGIHALMKRYRNPVDEYGVVPKMFVETSCPLCSIYRNQFRGVASWVRGATKPNTPRAPGISDCAGCIMADEFCMCCAPTVSYVRTFHAYSLLVHNPSDKIQLKVMRERVTYLTKLINNIKDLDEARFNPESWIYFDQSVIPGGET